jgi:Zn-dependent M28 family amino/carboxypeptidase
MRFLLRISVLTAVSALIAVAVLWAVLTQPIWCASAKETAVSVHPARLERHVWMLSETFVPRDAGHPANLDRVAAYIREEFDKAGGRIVEQPFQVDGSTCRNVIAYFGPETHDRIVVGAHYDAFGEWPGTDDNAGAVAGLIELAHLLRETPPRILVELVAFSLEEPPYYGTSEMGSAVHASFLKAQNRSVRIMICLEMIGYFSDHEGSQRFPSGLLEVFYPTTGNYIAVVGRMDQTGVVRRVKRAMRRASPLPVLSINAPELVPGIDFSDHRNYWQAGWKAVMITDTAFYRNENYHSARDTADTLDYKRMAMVVQGVHAAVLDFGK